MARPTIEYACGCVVTETHVVAMCLEHDRQLRAKAQGERVKLDTTKRELLKAIEELGK